jgi:hypothetical protein
MFNHNGMIYINNMTAFKIIMIMNKIIKTNNNKNNKFKSNQSLFQLKSLKINHQYNLIQLTIKLYKLNNASYNKKMKLIINYQTKFPNKKIKSKFKLI